jgi:uncharacterized hydrophobic protein (TIGR00271 family)
MHEPRHFASDLAHARAALARVIEPIQDRLATSLGVRPAERTATVVAMLTSNVRRAPGYWIQLFIAAGIATLGLALNSTAVVIGAMLVSPLMGPLVELGMGFAVGSSLLVLRAALCVFLSVAGVVALSAVMTLALPFHEVTPEIAARTAPTLLDLLIAIFCALVATYTTIRQTADTTAAAAGTAVGIALVPPLCVTGFGVGTANLAVAGGAGLLFVANFSAIVVFAALVFSLLGYMRVDAVAIEQQFLDTSIGRTTHLARRAHETLRHAFGSQYGLAMRLLVPVVFIMVIYVPLSRALDDVARQVRVREAVRRALASTPAAFQTELVIERNTVALRLLTVGTVTEAAQLEEVLTKRLTEDSGVPASVTVTAVPDAEALDSRLAAAARPAPPPIVRLDLRTVRQQIGDALASAWPPSGGELVGWGIEVTDGGTPILTVRHLGLPLGAAGEEMLSRRISDLVGAPARVVDLALPAEPVVTGAAPTDMTWLVPTIGLLDQVWRVRDLSVCVAGPIASRTRAGDEARAVAAALQNTDAAREGRLTLTPAERWSVRVARACDSAPDVVQAANR